MTEQEAGHIILRWTKGQFPESASEVKLIGLVHQLGNDSWEAVLAIGKGLDIYVFFWFVNSELNVDKHLGITLW